MSSRGVYVALSGAIAQQQQLDVTANNLANAGTEGYVKSRVVFREVLARAGASERYVTSSETVLDTAPGSLRNTNRGLDAALPAGTFAAVDGGANGERYTRALSLSVSPDGQLKTASGDVVVGENGAPLRLNPKLEASLGKNGEVLQGGEVVGRLKLVSFAKPERLTHEGSGRLAANAQSGAAAPTNATIEVGALEDSNASTTEAMTAIVSASRAFEAFERAIQTFHDEDRRLVTTVPGTGGG
jgi:flagellar basal body rod protein FlgG